MPDLAKAHDSQCLADDGDAHVLGALPLAGLHAGVRLGHVAAERADEGHPVLGSCHRVGCGSIDHQAPVLRQEPVRAWVASGVCVCSRLQVQACLAALMWVGCTATAVVAACRCRGSERRLRQRGAAADACCSELREIPTMYDINAEAQMSISTCVSGVITALLCTTLRHCACRAAAVTCFGRPYLSG